MTRRVAIVVAALSWFVLGAGGCRAEAWNDDTVPPFRTAPFGPGLDVTSNGRRVDIVERGGGLVARYRVSRTGLRVYDEHANQLGRVVVAADGWDVERADGSIACTLRIDGDSASLECGPTILDLVADEGGWSLHAGERVVAHVGSGDAEAELSYAGEREPAIRFDEGVLSVRTHPDARQWLNIDVSDWEPSVLVLSRVELSEVPPSALPLVRGALAFALARLVDAMPGESTGPAGFTAGP